MHICQPRFLKRLACLALATLLGGCIPALYSEDPATRLQAVAEENDQRTLFLMALDVTMPIGRNYGAPDCIRGICRANYQADVRLAAVKRLTTAPYLLICASWGDGEGFHEAYAHIPTKYTRGRDYDFSYSDYGFYTEVAPGDAVREAAFKQLATPETFADLCNFLANPFPICSHTYVRAINQDFPLPTYCEVASYGEGSQNDSAFYDVYKNLRTDNPTDLVLCRALAEQPRENVLHFLRAAQPYASECLVNAYTQALDQVDEIPKELARTLFSAFQDQLEKRQICTLPKTWLMRLYFTFEEPTLQDLTFLFNGFPRMPQEEIDAILRHVKDESHLAQFYCDNLLLKSCPKPATLGISYDTHHEDYPQDLANHYAKRLTTPEACLKVALEAPSFALRLAAINRISDEPTLAKVIANPLKDTPYNTDFPGNFDSLWSHETFEWKRRTAEASALALRLAAIKRISTPDLLLSLRREAAANPLRRALSLRLRELGYSDVEAIITATEYTPFLLAQFETLQPPSDLEAIATRAKLRGIRLMAASQLCPERLRSIAESELPALSKASPESQLNFDGFYLGRSIEEIFALFGARLPSLQPILYFDDGVLCLADRAGHDLAWANRTSLKTHWLTLPAELLCRQLNLETGSFSDLERAIERTYHLSFSTAAVSKGNVSQTIGNTDTLAGETCRFFRTPLTEKASLSTALRHAYASYAISAEPLNGGLGVAFASLLEDARQANQNSADAHSYRFSPRGSIQLQWTKNAPKCSSSSTDNPFEDAANLLLPLLFSL